MPCCPLSSGRRARLCSSTVVFSSGGARAPAAAAAVAPAATAVATATGALEPVGAATATATGMELCCDSRREASIACCSSRSSASSTGSGGDGGALTAGEVAWLGEVAVSRGVASSMVAARSTSPSLELRAARACASGKPSAQRFCTAVGFGTA
eukprot:scaffold21045_cov59-Phaeocystis_antarctica.AAC.2